MPNNDKLVIQSLIVRCKLLMERPDSLDMEWRLKKGFQLRTYQHSFILITIHEVLPSHVETIIRHEAGFRKK